MFTSLVEYSLIGAAVMFIVWRNIKHEDDEHASLRESDEILRINTKNTIIGKLENLYKHQYKHFRVYFGHCFLNRVYYFNGCILCF